MSGAAFLRVAKLKGSGIIKTAARHNKREIQAEVGASGSINPRRSNLNYSLVGPSTADGVAQLADDLMAAAGVDKLRKDAVRGLEIVVSLPVGSDVDDRAYFASCVEWAGGYFACQVLSADVHLDEAAKHCHLMLLPLRNGRMVGNKLMGGRAALLAMQKHFHNAVATGYGLRKAPAKLSGPSKRDAAALVLRTMRESGDSVLQSKLWATFRDAIEKGPEPFLEALGLVADAKAKPGRTMVQIFTSTGKGAKNEAEQGSSKQKAIAFQKGLNQTSSNAIAFGETSCEKSKGYVSVAFAKNHQTFQPAPPPAPTLPAVTTKPDLGTTHAPIAAPAIKRPAPKPARPIRKASDRRPTPPATMDDPFDSVTRERESAHEAGAWCEQTGEFIPVATPARSSRQAADAWVHAKLAESF